MTLGLGLLFAAGVGLLIVSVLWPRRAGGDGKEVPGRVGRFLDTTGLGWPPGALVALVVSGGIVAAIAVRVVTGLTAVGVLAGLAAAPVPVSMLTRVAQERRRRTLDAWPDAIDALLAGVRSGDSLPGALATAAASGPVPLRVPLTDAAASVRATGDFPGAVRALGAALGDPVSRQVSAALVLAHDVGGRDLPTVMRDLAAFVRDERALRRELEARQAWTVNAARVAAAGPWMVLLLLSVRGETRTAFAGGAGTIVVVIGAAMTFMGYRLMRILGRLPGAADT